MVTQLLVLEVQKVGSPYNCFFLLNALASSSFSREKMMIIIRETKLQRKKYIQIYLNSRYIQTHLVIYVDIYCSPDMYSISRCICQLDISRYIHFLYTSRYISRCIQIYLKIRYIWRLDISRYTVFPHKLSTIIPLFRA